MNGYVYGRPPHTAQYKRALQGLQKWESTVGEALVKLRDFSELRISPACQRLHLLLEEILGWSQL